jgi:hypothetical protein
MISGIAEQQEVFGGLHGSLPRRLIEEIRQILPELWGFNSSSGRNLSLPRGQDVFFLSG